MERSVSEPSTNVRIKPSMTIVHLSATMKLSTTITALRLKVHNRVSCIAQKKLINVQIKLAGKTASAKFTKNLMLLTRHAMRINNIHVVANDA